MQNDTITISRHHSNDASVKLAICHALAQVRHTSALSLGPRGCKGMAVAAFCCRIPPSIGEHF